MENDFKSLVASRTFWGASLALSAIVATSFHLTTFAAWAVDPHSLDVVLNGVAMAGALAAMLFRGLATKKISTVLPAANPAKVQSHWMVGFMAFEATMFRPVSLFLAACIVLLPIGLIWILMKVEVRLFMRRSARAKVQSHWAIGVLLLAGAVLAGCANLTTQQQANLQAELSLGDKAVQVTKNLYCLYEPVTAKIIGVFDTSSNTTTLLAKLDTATALICSQAQSAMVAGT